MGVGGAACAARGSIGATLVRSRGGNPVPYNGPCYVWGTGSIRSGTDNDFWEKQGITQALKQTHQFLLIILKIGINTMIGLCSIIITLLLLGFNMFQSKPMFLKAIFKN